MVNEHATMNSVLLNIKNYPLIILRFGKTVNVSGLVPHALFNWIIKCSVPHNALECREPCTRSSIAHT